MKKRAYILCAAIIALCAALLLWLDVPSWKPLDVDRLTVLPEATILYDREGSLLTSLYASENRKSLSPEEIPPRVAQAFVSIEDARFYEHHGVDLYRIFGAMLHNLRSGSLGQGASTITQQLIKLTHLSSEKTFSRKTQEAYLALQLERKLSKEEILTAYLNVVYFGHGAYGIASAAEVYFDKTADELTLAEAALLAGVVKSPCSYAPHLHPENAQRRRDLVLDAMAENGWITREEAEEAKGEALVLHLKEEERGSWYADAVLAEAARVLGVGADEIYTGGYRIDSTICADRQRAADKLFASTENFPADAADGTPCQAAFVSVDNRTGAVLCLEGGRSYSLQRGLNRALQARRQPGSILKPLSVYAAAIDLYGYTPVSLLSDVSREFAPGYTPSNAGGEEHGTVTLRQALSRSMNLATLDLASRVSVDAALVCAQRLGLSLTEDDRNLSLALGCLAEGVTPLEVCGAYATLANGGQYAQPYLIERICDAQGREIYRHEGKKTRVLKETTAAMLVSTLSTAASEGTARALGAVGRAVAGKTGTVSREGGGNQDIWTAAMTVEETCTVWMGFDRTDEGHALPEGTVGGGYPARLAAAYLLRAGGSEEAAFEVPDGLTRVCLDAAALREEGKLLLAGAQTPREQIMEELLPASQAPTATSDLWEMPDAPEGFALNEQLDGSALFSVLSLDEHVEYRLMRRNADGSQEQIAALQGARGAFLTYREEAAQKKNSNAYWVVPVQTMRQKYGLEGAQGEASGEIVWTADGLMKRIFPARRETPLRAEQTPIPDGGRSLFEAGS